MSDTITGQDAAHRRRRLADELQSGGDLRAAPWRHAVETVAREVFLGDCVYRRVDTPTATLWEPIERESTGESAWLQLAYENITWVTQFDATDRTPSGALQGSPTSSSTLPGLVVRMLEDLHVQDGHRVLEIGTGTGYSTGLLCERLGDEHVTSVEIDEGVAARARTALAAAGYSPTLVAGDGLAGHAPGAPYDRIIATCSVRTVPPVWLAQAAPGARILVTLSGWLYGSGLVALDVTDAGTAEGRYLPGTVSFMPARAHAAPLLTRFPARQGDTRPATHGADILDDWMGRFLAELAAPTAVRARLLDDGGTTDCDVLVDQTTGSAAWLTLREGRWTVQQTGPTQLWDQIERAYEAWQRAGRPPQHAFTVHLTPREQTVAFNAPDGRLSWRLPVCPT